MKIIMVRVSMIFFSEIIDTTTPSGGVFSIELYNSIEKQYEILVSYSDYTSN